MPDPTRMSESDEHGGPAELRAAILREHADIRGLLDRVERTARRLAVSAPPHEAERAATCEAVRLLCTVMTAHIDLENRVLAPVLERLDARGKVRADRLRAEHAVQLSALRSYVTAFEHLSTATPPGAVLVEVVQQLLKKLRDDIEAEEQTTLSAELWRDDPTSPAVEAG